jgi:PP-loop superfamily ATP-utilizing enzyme
MYIKKMKRIINFSGGKTSALMTIILKPTNEDIVLFTDTGREHPLTYKFIDDFANFENINVIKVKHELGFDKFKTSLPNRVKRMCTSDLKIITAKKYLRSLNIRTFENYIGFRADEMHRVNKRQQKFKKVFDKFPLVDLGITKYDVNTYWKNKKYNLEIPSILGNCDLCFLKGKNAIINILRQHPDLADKWIKDEERTGKTYFKDVKYKELLNVAQNQKTFFDLHKVLPAYSCECNSI